MSRTKATKIALAAAAAAGILCTAAASAAYWTDRVNIQSEVRTMDIGIMYDSEQTGLENSLYLPGDSRNFSFTVKNTGDVSVDVKPVITITASKDMRTDGAAFCLVDSSGQEVKDFQAVYYDSSQAEVDAEKGAPFRSVSYTYTGEKTLAGREHKDASMGETKSDEVFTYGLKLKESAGNEFIGTTAELGIETFAIQHRNREDGPKEWIRIAAAR